MTTLFFERFLKYNRIKKIILGILFVPTISGIIILFTFRSNCHKIHRIGIEGRNTEVWYVWQVLQMFVALIVALPLNFIVLSSLYNYFF